MLRQDAQRSEHSRRILRAVGGVEHAWHIFGARAAAHRRHLKNQLAFLRNRHGDRKTTGGWNNHAPAVLERRVMDGGVGIAVLTHDCDLGMTARRGLGELHRDVGHVTHVRQNPDFGLACFALDDRLELPVDGELHVALFVRQRRVGRHVLVAAVACGGEALQVARDELQ
jgi:hypothetical protein